MSAYDLNRNDYRKNPKRSDIETPAWLADWLASLFPTVKRVLDPCAGAHRALLQPFEKRGCETIWYEVKDGKDFFACQDRLDVDLVVANPPFNSAPRQRLAAEVWLESILRVVGDQVSICLFVPFGFRLNNKMRSKRLRWLRTAAKISSIISLPLDAFPGVLFHSEVIIFNAAGHHLEPHYFPPEPLHIRMRALGSRTSAKKAAAARKNGRKAASAAAREKMRQAWERRRQM